MLVSIN